MTRRPLDDEGLPEQDPDDFSDPSNPDFDLSNASPVHFGLNHDPKPWFVRRWFALIVAFLIIFGLVVPFVWRI